MTVEFRPAHRSEAKPLIGVYAESGNGKTYGALLVARGFVGEKGSILMTETESGRGEAYCDPTEYPEIGGYDVASIRGEFSPGAYYETIQHAEKERYDALIIDSASHEWEGAGGVLDMAAKNEADGKKGVLVWQQPKLVHQRKFILPLTQTSVPLVIVCMRAKYPMKQVVVNGKRDWQRSEKLEPKQSEDILHEMFVHGWVDESHNFHITKNTNRALADVFLDGKPLSVETGQKLRAWAEQRARPDRTPKVSEPEPEEPSAPRGAATASPYVILRQGGPSACETISQWRDRMLTGIARLAPHQAKVLWDRNADLMAEYEKNYPGDVGVVIAAFEEKCGP